MYVRTIEIEILGNSLLPELLRISKCDILPHTDLFLDSEDLKTSRCNEHTPFFDRLKYFFFTLWCKNL